MKNCKLHPEDDTDECELPTISEPLIGNTKSAVNSVPCLYPHGKHTYDAKVCTDPETLTWEGLYSWDELPLDAEIK